MMVLRAYIFLIPILWLTSFVPHEYHVTMIDIRQNVEERQLEISMQLFIDDFEKAMYVQKTKVKIGDDINETQLREAIRSYILKHFRLSINGKPAELSFLGSEWDKDLHSFFAYLEAPIESEISQLELFNDIFTEVSDQQENMHHLYIGKMSKSILLNKRQVKASFELGN